MWFVSKKKYDAMVAERDRWDTIAATATIQNGRLLKEWGDAIETMKGVQKLNRRLIEHNDELLARIKKLEAELQGTRQDSQQWAKDFEELDIAYGQLEIERDELREERDHYEERCRYLEDELAHYEAEEEGKYLTREAE